MADRPSVSVHLLPALIPPGALKGGVAVVVDVLRATTAMVHALAAGCEAVFPCGEVDEARRLAAALPAGSAILGGERQGLPIEGFDLGNSPGSYTPEVCRGKSLVMTTTNGTRAILASQEADRVAVAGFVNLQATLRWLATAAAPIHVVCAGTDGTVSLEDSLLAGALVSEWRRAQAEGHPGDFYDLDDTALMLEGAWAEAFHRMNRADSADEELVRLLSRGRGGRRVREIGLAPDIREAARLDRLDLAVELRRGPLRLVRAD